MKRFAIAALIACLASPAFADTPPASASTPPALVCTWQDDDVIVLHVKTGAFSVALAAINDPGNVTPNNKNAILSDLMTQAKALEAKRCK
jgi:hypothetical protein